MMNKNDPLIEQLHDFGLEIEEAKVYLELLRKPSTHAQLNQTTGINRTTLYRITTKLERRGIISRRTNDEGKFLVAIDPSALEMLLMAKEEQVRQQRDIFSHILPSLTDIKNGGTTDFTVNTYEGVEGFKQMLWNELSTKNVCYCIGYGTLEDLGVSRTWAEKHRQFTVDAGYSLFELGNPGHIPVNFSVNDSFLKQYSLRFVPRSVLSINQLTVIYNDTVATYGMKNEKRVGLEIICENYAQFMRQIFEHYWKPAKKPKEVMLDF